MEDWGHGISCCTCIKEYHNPVRRAMPVDSIDLKIMRLRLDDVMAAHTKTDWNLYYKTQLPGTGATLVAGPPIPGGAVYVQYNLAQSLFVVSLCRGKITFVKHTAPDDVIECVGELRASLSASLHDSQ